MYLLVGKGLILVAIVEVNGSIAKLCTGKFICGFSVLYLYVERGIIWGAFAPIYFLQLHASRARVATQ